MVRISLLYLFLYVCFVCTAQKAVNVSGEYKYIIPENVTIDKAKQIAIEQARLEAMSAEFKTVVSQINTTSMIQENGVSHSSFSSYGGTEIVGEWLGDTRETEVSIISENNMLVVIAKVWGKARELKKSSIELMIEILCNDVASEQFNSGDRFAVKFKTPVNGYFAIFLIDEYAEKAYSLLPYENGNGKARSVVKNKEYEFLTVKDSEYPYMENTILTAIREVEFNRLAFVFSTEEFALPLSDMGEFVMELPLEKFIKWLRKNRVKDKDMQTIEKIVEIKKR